jgi:hypothetical protein
MQARRIPNSHIGLRLQETDQDTDLPPGRCGGTKRQSPGVFAQIKTSMVPGDPDTYVQTCMLA